MLENAIYSVISPEGCASIMWRDAGKRADAAAALKITSAEIRALGCIDDVVAEPAEGAQADVAAAAELLDEALVRISTRSSRCRSRNWWRAGRQSSGTWGSFTLRERSRLHG